MKKGEWHLFFVQSESAFWNLRLPKRREYEYDMNYDMSASAQECMRPSAVEGLHVAAVSTAPAKLLSKHIP